MRPQFSTSDHLCSEIDRFCSLLTKFKAKILFKGQDKGVAKYERERARGEREREVDNDE